LIYNGHTEYGSHPSSDAICYKCKLKINEHGSVKDHTGKPSFFAVIYGEIPKEQVTKTLDTFNSLENIDGAVMKIIIGSEVVREGIDFKELKHIYVLTLPYNIANMI
jgi:superfamily II DNA/RNA helicase